MTRVVSYAAVRNDYELFSSLFFCYGVAMRKITSTNLDDLATVLSGLKPEQREQLELALAPAEEQEILTRSKKARALGQRGKLLAV